MTTKLCALLTLAVFVSSTGAALADSCWDHNGSLMRLQASGSHREFTYERPKASMRHLVSRGTVLFDGEKDGNWYAGVARVFSSTCGNPWEYFVEGPVASNQLKVTVSGKREVFSGCQATGRTKTDTLVFTWVGDDC